VDGFIVLYRHYDDDVNNYERQTVTGSATRHAVLHQLDSDTAYSIVIRSFNRHGHSPLSNTVVMTTFASAARGNTSHHHHHHHHHRHHHHHSQSLSPRRR